MENAKLMASTALFMCCFLGCLWIFNLSSFWRNIRSIDYLNSPKYLVAFDNWILWFIPQIIVAGSIYTRKWNMGFRYDGMNVVVLLAGVISVNFLIGYVCMLYHGTRIKLYRIKHRYDDTSVLGFDTLPTETSCYITKILQYCACLILSALIVLEEADILNVLTQYILSLK